MPLERMSRLVDVLESDSGEARFGLAFSFDDQRQVRVDVQVSATVELRCQRSLEVYMQPIQGRSTVGVVANEELARALPGDYEPMLCPDNRLRLVDLVEEELLLAMPLVPRDPNSEPVAQEAPREDTHRPLAGLAELRAGKKDK